MNTLKKISVICLIFLEVLLVASFISMMVSTYHEDDEHVISKRIESYETVKISDKKIKEIVLKYLDLSPYSRTSLIEELFLREKIDKKQSKKVIDNMDIDWCEQADRELDSLLAVRGYSKDEAIEALKVNGFNQKTIETALKERKINWTEQARIKAKSYKKSGLSKEDAEILLTEDGFNKNEREKALEIF